MNPHRFWPRPRVAAALAGLLLASPTTARSETVDTVRKSFTVEPGGRLVVDVGTGALDVTTTRGKDVSVEIVTRVSAGSKESETEFLRSHAVTFDHTGGTVTIRSPRRSASRSLFDFWRTRVSANVRFSIAVPERFDADLDTAGGAIEVTGLSGTLRAETSGGSIRLDGCTGAAKVHTSGGSITVRAHRGDVKADTSGGGINVDGVTGSLHAETSGGAIRAVWPTAPTAASRLSTSGGSVTVSLPETAALDLDASTSGGGVHSDFSVDGTRSRNHLKGRINGGGPLLYLHTSGGGVHVTSMRQSASLARERR
jgi:DUF4097 and DUF4098 domain-containing protein YvlB